eukprot:5483527-Alexandrium_andersonii.AAC.1
MGHPCEFAWGRRHGGSRGGSRGGSSRWVSVLRESFGWLARFPFRVSPSKRPFANMLWPRS